VRFMHGVRKREDKSRLGDGQRRPSPDLLPKWSLIVPVKEEHDEVLKGTLLGSPEIDDRCDLIIKCGYRSAGEAYNAGISEASSEILVFCHSDVYLPSGWLGELTSAVRELGDVDPNWGVLGVAGVTANGRVSGYLYSTGLKAIVGERFAQPLEATSLDEVLLVVRRSSMLKFDEELPGFHLYGTDICLEAKKRGMRSYVISAFCVHNSIGVRYLPRAFWRAYIYMRKKWWAELPVTTCCTTIAKSGWPILHHVISRSRDHLFCSVDIGTRCDNPEALVKRLAARGESVGSRSE